MTPIIIKMTVPIVIKLIPVKQNDKKSMYKSGGTGVSITK